MARIPQPVTMSGSPRGIRSRARGSHELGRMNQTEAKYASYLEGLRHTGLIQWWGFECVKIRLADATFYTPDFLVAAQDGTLEVHEVKACWKPKFGPRGELVRKAGAGWQEDARVKFKVAAEHFPAVFKGVHQDPGGEWRVEIF